jgi:hypothetical protein
VVPKEGGGPQLVKMGQLRGPITHCTIDQPAKIQFGPDSIDNIILTCPRAGINFTGWYEAGLGKGDAKNLFGDLLMSSCVPGSEPQKPPSGT